jgi:hypothetical protein
MQNFVMLRVINDVSFILSVENKPFMLSVIILNGVMLSVVVLVG